jgi:hypothetical protein
MFRLVVQTVYIHYFRFVARLRYQFHMTEGKRPLGRPRCRWEDGIRMDLREIGWRSVDWIQLAQVRDQLRALVNTVMNLRVLAPQS